MKRSWIWALILGLMLGTAAGLGLSCWVFAPPSAEASALLRNFSFQEVAEKAEHSKWEILDDKITIYSPVPFLGGPQRIERRIVARAALSNAELVAFALQFDTVVEEGLRSAGAQPYQPGPAGSVSSSLQWQPARFYYRTGYRLGDADGVLVVSLKVPAGEAPAIVRLTR